MKMNFRKILRCRRDRTYKSYKSCTDHQRFIWLIKQKWPRETKAAMSLILNMRVKSDIQGLKGFKHD